MIKSIALTLSFATMGLNVAQAAPAGTVVGISSVQLQNGANSSALWRTPTAGAFKVFVQVPTDGTATNALYRVYPRGNLAGNTACSATDATYPCFEVPVNQAANQGKWLQLTLNSDVKTQWKFTLAGFVTVNASNLAATELLSLGSLVFQNTALKIGQKYGGGIIFYLDSTGQHGLIAAPTDQSTGIQWYNGSYTVTGATGTAVGTGKANTAAIVANQKPGSYAAQLADDLVIGTYKDWYLPSTDELHLMYTNIGQGATGALYNVGGFAANYYWSSSEDTNNYARVENFDTRYQGGGRKDITFYVRAVRSF